MRDMPRTRAASSCVSPKVRRRRLRAERIQAWASSARLIGFSSDRELNKPAPIAAPKRTDFDRYANDPDRFGCWFNARIAQTEIIVKNKCYYRNHRTLP